MDTQVMIEILEDKRAEVMGNEQPGISSMTSPDFGSLFEKYLSVDHDGFCQTG